MTAEYDLAGNLIAETDPEGARTAYAYDAVNRLTAVTDALGGVTRYRCDAADNLAAVVDALGHETSYTYDKNGKLAMTLVRQGATLYGKKAGEAEEILQPRLYPLAL